VGRSRPHFAAVVSVFARRWMAVQRVITTTARHPQSLSQMGFKNWKVIVRQVAWVILIYDWAALSIRGTIEYEEGRAILEQYDRTV
jgi:hypothetical protein